jgi:hypothetical protein
VSEALERIEQPRSLIEVIAQAVLDPRLDVEKMSKLLDMQERILEQERRQQFAEALAQLQARIPQIDKHGAIQDNSGKVRNKYAKYEDIDIVLRPMIADAGFSVTFNEEDATAAGRRYSCTLLHRGGHSVTKYLTLPLDSSGSKNSIQGAGSTFSYARRYLLTAHLNLVQRGEDIDGNDPTLVSLDQSTAIRDLIKETGSNEKTFLELIAGVDSIEAIQARDYKRVTNALEVKKRSKK